MLTPGVPSAKVAEDLTSSRDWPQAVVDDTMRVRYGTEGYHPAAAFDVFDLDPRKMELVRSAVSDLFAAVEALGKHGAAADALHDVRSDIASIRGMARFGHSAGMPWHADRPAQAVFEKIAADDRLPGAVRTAARRASDAVGSLVLAHAESQHFGPFGSSYADAAGPTAHLPTTKKSYDAWADAGVSETHNGFYDAVDGRTFARAIGAYDRSQDAAGQTAEGETA